MRPFFERNPVRTGGIAVFLILAVTLVSLNYDKLPFFRSGKTHAAYFAEAGGLTPGNAVQVSGFRVGQVSTVQLDGPRVLVTFRVADNVHLGDRTEAAVKLKTVLGAKVLEITPRGERALDGPIPLDRTASAYQLPDALGDLTSTISGLNTDQLSTSLAVLANTFSGTPPDLKAAVHGVARFSDTLNERDAQLRDLLSDANKASKVLADRTNAVVGLITKTNALLIALRTESEALDKVSNSISAVSQQVSGFIAENRDTLKPALEKLNGVLATLDNRKERVQKAILGLNRYAMGLGEAVSSGPFFKAYVSNLLPGQFVQPFIDAAFSDLGLDPNVLPPSQLTDPQVGQPGTPALPIPFPRTGQGGDPHLTLPDAITGNPGDPRYPYREPLPAPPPGGPPPGPPALAPSAGNQAELPPSAPAEQSAGVQTPPTQPHHGGPGPTVPSPGMPPSAEGCVPQQCGRRRKLWKGRSRNRSRTLQVGAPGSELPSATAPPRTGMARYVRIGVAGALALVLAGSVFVVSRLVADAGRAHLTAYFANSTGLYTGDDVVILGVRVGKVEKIQPQPEGVKVTFSYDNKYKVPAAANAVILSPSLLTPRSIQLTPAYTGGPVMENGAVIPRERTAVPVEFDDLRQQLERLTQILQPTEPGGASTLGSFINTAADNLRGQGGDIHDTIVRLSQAISALGDHSDDLYGTVKNLSILVSALRDSGDLLGQLNQNLAAATGLLADDPDEIASVARNVYQVTGDVKTFVADNRETLGITTDKLASVSRAVNDSLDDIKQLLHVAPTGFQNFINIYQPAQATLTGIAAVNNLANPIEFICGAVQAASRLGAEQSAKLCAQYMAPIVKNRQVNFLPFGENLFIGAMARPNEVTYSEDWMRPDYIPPPVPPAGAPPLAAEAPPASAAISTDPNEGLPGIMVPPGPTREPGRGGQ